MASTNADTDYDLVVVGGGSGGLTGARAAARLGARVLLVERDRLGGDCLWTGCVPSKTLLHVAADVRAAARAAGYGLTVGGTVDLEAAMGVVREAIAAIEPHDAVEALATDGVETVLGQAVFDGPRSVRIDGRSVSFRYALVATGSRPVLPPIPGLDQVGVLTSDTVWDLRKLPERLVVLGGGPIGCELGQAFARLGADVVLAEALERLLPREESDAADVVRRALQAEGVTVLTGFRAERAEPGVLRGPGRVLEFDTLLVTTGRAANTSGLDLPRAGVKLTDRGYVRVDGRLRTSNRRIYAAGDVTGISAFTHLAGVQAAAAVTDALLGVRRRIDYRAVPWVTFTDPELARVGLTEAEAKERYGSRSRAWSLPHERVDRAVADHATEGFTRLVTDPRGRIVGASVLAPRAGETIAELATAVRRHERPAEFARTVHSYPTYGDGPWHAALTEVYHRMALPPTRSVIRAVLRARRAVYR